MKASSKESRIRTCAPANCLLLRDRVRLSGPRGSLPADAASGCWSMFRKNRYQFLFASETSPSNPRTARCGSRAFPASAGARSSPATERSRSGSISLHCRFAMFLFFLQPHFIEFPPNVRRRGSRAIFASPEIECFSRFLRTCRASRQWPAASFPDDASSRKPFARAAKAAASRTESAARAPRPKAAVPGSKPASIRAGDQRNRAYCLPSSSATGA